MTGVYPSTQEIEQAAKLIRDGKLVAFPTETVYGLGADATNEQAVQAIYSVKGRPSNNPLIVHVATFEDLMRYTDLSKSSEPELLKNRLLALKPIWPGPLSVIVPKASEICSSVSAGGPTVALRIPRHPTALRLITTCKRPVAAPSANPSTYISPTTAQHVRDSLGSTVAAVLDGGPCEIGLESTVLSLVGSEPTILRPGAVTESELARLLGCPVRINQTAASESIADSATTLLSPGLMAKHYSPQTPVRLISGLNPALCQGLKIGAILFSKETKLCVAPKVCITLSEHGALEEVAAKLFSALRELDSAKLDLIVVDTCEPIGLGAAIMDRLFRASMQTSA
jgi:L-threonylcarbamoyladenylate synthase